MALYRPHFKTINRDLVLQRATSVVLLLQATIIIKYCNCMLVLALISSADKDNDSEVNAARNQHHTVTITLQQRVPILQRERTARLRSLERLRTGVANTRVRSETLLVVQAGLAAVCLQLLEHSRIRQRRTEPPWQRHIWQAAVIVFGCLPLPVLTVHPCVRHPRSHRGPESGKVDTAVSVRVGLQVTGGNRVQIKALAHVRAKLLWLTD